MNLIWNLLILLGALVIGGGVTYLIMRTTSLNIIKKAEEEAEVIKKNKMLEIKEKSIALKLEHDNQVREDDKRKAARENQLNQRENQLNQRQGELQRAQNDLNQKTQQLEAQNKALEFKTIEIEKMNREAQKQLEAISGISAEDAKKQLVEALRDEAKTAAMAYINDTMEEARINAKKEAQKIIIQTIQRCASETTVENAVTVFHLDNEEVKGRIIGREGRNIRAWKPPREQKSLSMIPPTVSRSPAMTPSDAR